ncbi:hypothetical protein BC777_0753 [Yoonia maricola]|uniref:Membrane-bound lysozyme inhibitor of c-type lysozyme MliC n=1 Tax=Yoonia maricola TaxID=420999 RepID=A0A2M8WLV7_9RHOB|nr:hypothetical protein [Yoonia maricola]PJI91912.1 hypothetical protein BC777_0753 [Yoonia maricola]
MKVPAVLCAVMAGPAMAEVVSCDLSGTLVRFEIERSQFAPPMNPNEPTQRRVTTVQMGDAQFPAEPIMMDNIRGFWAEGAGGSDIMMVMQGDGSAVYADTSTGARLTGTCEVSQ